MERGQWMFRSEQHIMSVVCAGCRTVGVSGQLHLCNTKTKRKRLLPLPVVCVQSANNYQPVFLHPNLSTTPYSHVHHPSPPHSNLSRSNNLRPVALSPIAFTFLKGFLTATLGYLKDECLSLLLSSRVNKFQWIFVFNPRHTTGTHWCPHTTGRCVEQVQNVASSLWNVQKQSISEASTLSVVANPPPLLLRLPPSPL